MLCAAVYIIGLRGFLSFLQNREIYFANDLELQMKFRNNITMICVFTYGLKANCLI